MGDHWLQHVNVKFPSAGSIDLTQAIPVFHRWIQEQALPGLLIDVADYRHVPEGPRRGAGSARGDLRAG